MESATHAAEILWRVARGLATGAGPLSERFRDVHLGGLHQLTPDRLPWPDLREPLRDILDYFEPDGHGRMIVETMNEEDQRRIAGEIFELYTEAAKVSGDE
jgi:hypothetical protein